jgi:hypothetical protein
MTDRITRRTLTPAQENEELARLLYIAAGHTMTPDEIQQQKISFVFGSLPEESTVTREDVERRVYEREGNIAAMEKRVSELEAEVARLRDAVLDQIAELDEG